ncbi:MAG: hypothetical protein HWN66_20090 [Candidatus Helarchaeota archaeon]|nr:hypothetical protein [Candidatus Helarchaeota archaeon]
MFKNVVSSGSLIEVVPGERNLPVDLALFREFAEIDILEREIRESYKEIDFTNSLKENPKTVATVKRELEECLKNYIAKAEADLKVMIVSRQIGATSPFIVRADDIANILRELVAWKSLSKQIYLVESTDVKGFTEEVRQARIKECREKIEKLNKKKEKYFPKQQREWYEKIGKQVANWKDYAKYFGFPVNINGVYLNGKNPAHKVWLEIYNMLEMEKIPRYKLLVPMTINGKEFIYHPGHKYDGK